MMMKLIIALLLLNIPGFTLCSQVTVSTPVGKISGTTSMTSFAGRAYNTASFYSIPYAEPATGDRRFSKPIKLAPFSDTYDATGAKPACPQNVKWFPRLEQLPVNEGCLSLDIFVPKNKHNTNSKAVVIYIHGGAFQYGTKDNYKSEAFAAVNDLIYVTVNYRLSAFGFLASRKHGLKGNYGLWDQHLAIRWVHDNIAAFGGDPQKVTLFGQSAGAVSVMYQVLFDGNKGLIQQVIAQSGSIGAYWTYNENPDHAFDDLVARTDCERGTSEEVIGCLRYINTLDLQNSLTFETSYLPIYDGDFVKYDPKEIYKKEATESLRALRQFADLDVIMGMNSDEGIVDFDILAILLGKNIEEINDGITQEEVKMYILRHFQYVNFSDDDNLFSSIIHQYTDWSRPDDPVSRRSMLLDLLKDISYTPAVIQAANAHTMINGKGKMYMYQFDHRPSFTQSPKWVKGANHMEEIPFVLAFPDSFLVELGVNSTVGVEATAEEFSLSIKMMNFWKNFANTGNPNDATDTELPNWPEYSLPNETYIVFDTGDTGFAIGSHFRREFVSYWTNVFPGLQSASGIKSDVKTTCHVNPEHAIGALLFLGFCCILVLIYRGIF